MSCVETGCIFQWTIEHFQFFPISTPEIISPSFTFNSIPNTQWHIELHNIANLSRFFLKRNSESLIPVTLQYCATVQFDDVTDSTGKKTVDFAIANDKQFLHKRVYKEISKKIYGNRNLVLVCHFDGVYFKHEKRTRFYYARTRAQVLSFNVDALLDFKKLLIPKGDVYKHRITKSTIQSYLHVAKLPCTLEDLSLQSTVTKYPLGILTKICLYNRYGKIVGTGRGFYNFRENSNIRQIIHFEGDKKYPITKYLEDSILKISVHFDATNDLLTNMERAEDLICIEKLDNQVSELNPYASLRNIELNYKIRICNQDFYANKDYLRVISPYFKNLIEQNDNECEIAEINNLDIVRFEKLFDIIYCKESLSNYKEYSDLHCFYKLSQRFQFVPLMKALSRALVSTFSVSNISEMFLLAGIYNDHDLRREALNYFIVHSKDVINQQTWKNFSENEPKLACKVITDAIETSL